ncbi:paired amphipathic helix protein Sin3-like 6 [Miscanthus floridulus]|uniref:paired amphipathic helix protein Sin3-like 6 n=1 Tax=Miscanthus floridulus TaxID=154761 RepID=UPI00345A959F
MGFRDKMKRSKKEEHGVYMKFRVRDLRPTQTLQDGLRFVKNLKRRLAREPDKYDEIITIMRQFMSGSICTAAVVERVKVLLEGHPDLLHHFNQFLPWGYIRAHGPLGRTSV